MKKIIFLILVSVPLFANSQVIVGEEELAEATYVLSQDSLTVVKTEVKEETIVTNVSLEELAMLMKKYNTDIESNYAQIEYFNSLIAKLQEEYDYLQSLGAKEGEKKGEKEGGGK